MTNLDNALLTAKSTNDYMPVYELLVNSEFFIPVHADDSQEKGGFRFDVFEMHEKMYIQAAESMEKLSSSNTDQAVRMPGHALIQSLHKELGIALSTGNNDVFVMPKETLEWLRQSMQRA